MKRSHFRARVSPASQERYQNVVDISPADKPAVVVLMATFNGARWIREQIASILDQWGVTITLYIRDDASVDGTSEMIAHMANREPRIKFVQARTSSGSAGANFRRLLADVPLEGFQFVALSDQDDVWDPRKLNEAIAAIIRTRVDGYSSAVHAFWPNGTQRVLRQSDRCTAADFLFEGAGQGCTFVLTAALGIRVQRFLIANEELAASLHYHDWLIYLLCRAWGMSWYFDSRYYIDYRQHDSNELGARGAPGFATRRLRLLRNGWYAKQITAAATIFATAGSPMSKSMARILNNFILTRSCPSRLKLFSVCIFHGRRKLSDRAFVAATALVGWL